MSQPSPRRPFDRDRMHLLPRDTIMTGSFKVLSAIQNEPAEVQAAAVATAFAILADKLRLEPREMHHMGQRIARPEQFHQKANCQAEALDDLLGMKITGSV